MAVHGLIRAGDFKGKNRVILDWWPHFHHLVPTVCANLPAHFRDVYWCPEPKNLNSAIRFIVHECCLSVLLESHPQPHLWVLPQLTEDAASESIFSDTPPIRSLLEPHRGLAGYASPFKFCENVFFWTFAQTTPADYLLG